MSQNEELNYPAYPIGWIAEDHLTDRSATTYDKDTADRWNKKGWPVRPIYDGSALAALSACSEQLRAEVSGLKTGYEAYKRVNAELKAEVEVFRGLLSEMRAIGNHAPAELTLRIDAAMGNSGIQSGTGPVRSVVAAMPCRELGEAFNAAYYAPRNLGSDSKQCRAGVLAVIDAAMGKGEQS